MRLKLFCFVATASILTPAFADDLWNQQVGLPVAFASFPDQEFDDGLYDIYNTYMADNVVVPTGGWSIDSISIVMTASNPTAFAALKQAKLSIFGATGATDVPLAINDPSQGSIVSVSVAPYRTNGVTFLVTASNLGIGLGAGDYWIGLTPVGGVVTYGQCYEAFSPNNPAGADFGSASRNMNGGYMFSTGSDWGSLKDLNSTAGDEYGAIEIQGVAAPEPGTVALIGLGAASLLRLRRRS